MKRKKTHRKPNQTMSVALLVWTGLVQLRDCEEASVAGAKPARVTEGGGEGRVVTGRSCRAPWATVQTLVLSLSDVGTTEGSEHWRDRT